MPHLRLPRTLARINRHVTNPIMGLWAPYLPPWAIVQHRGRKSGREYRTVIFAFRRDDMLIVALTYGETDWLRNVQAAGEAGITRFGRTVTIREPHVIQAAEAESLPRGLRWTARVFGASMVATIDR
jgi:deazaflavin-dependent oxidoreductase (nitroreductase family)